MSLKRVLVWVVCYSIAMGFLEAAVVIYLRSVMYPGGFTFPLRPLNHNLAVVELWREVATIVMLLAVGMLVGKNKAERLAYFILSFAIWDIFYYVFLYVFLAWPESLFTWDILFLIPVPWVGPVITPVLIAATMIAFAVTIIQFSAAGMPVTLKWREISLLVLGSTVAVASFIEDYVRQNGAVVYEKLGNGGSLLSEMGSYIPARFDWPLYAVGEGMLLFAYVLYFRRIKYMCRVKDRPAVA